MQGLKCSEEEAKEVYDADIAIDKGEKLFELTAEQKQAEKKMRATGTKKPTVYNFNKRERKANLPKAEIISKVYEFILANIADTAEVTNKERQIAFSLNGENYEFTLVQKRKPK
jgi:hypothetical protein